MIAYSIIWPRSAAKPRWSSAIGRAKGSLSSGQGFRAAVADHSKANEQLAQLAQAANLPQPGDLDEEHKATRIQLEKLSGADFDLAYIRGQIGAHQTTAQLFAWQIGSGQDPQFRIFASQVLPIVLRHLRSARAVEYQLTATASAAGGPA